MIADLIPIAGRRFGPDLDHPVCQFWITDSIYPTADEVLERLEHHVLPYLAQHVSEVDLRALWSSTGCMIQGPTLKV